MSQKEQKPTLTGHRTRTRKRDEKEKYDPTGFRDSILQGLNEAGTDLEQVSKFLVETGHKLNYRLYGETLLDILFAGGILAPGGSVVEDTDKTKVCRSEVCVFTTEEDVKAMQNFWEQVFSKVTRRFKYLEKKLQDELSKIILFLKGFSEMERKKVAMFTSILLAENEVDAKCLLNLFNDHLVKDGIALQFAVDMFAVWLKEKDMTSIATVLSKAQLDNRLLELMPISKRSEANFENIFTEAGLTDFAKYQRARAHAESKKQLYKELSEIFEESGDIKEIQSVIQETMKKNDFTGKDIIGVLWRVMMNSHEWPKKEELIPEQVGRCFKNYMPLFKTFVNNERTEAELLLKMQEYCHANMRKMFSKMVTWFYSSDVLSEDEILKWYKCNNNLKGKAYFNEQMKKFVDWLNTAEEESDEDDDEDEEEDQDQEEK
ncbi:eIF5-mimic protein 2-like [Lytechinus pictus]|uniref:eIF5-mimic protein 2-like n=1 Tax=Lytechinus pictus TaxID=7653 RepID=UPI00240DCA1A|nr:eIF5-mimic protein 2-like [Lytechinus pictus]